MLYLKHPHYLIFSKFASPFGRVSPTDRSGGAQLATRPNVAFGTGGERSLKSCENVFCLYLVQRKRSLLLCWHVEECITTP